MGRPLIRVLSDLHFGDRGTYIKNLRELRPLLEGADHVILNGDTLDTRPGPSPAATAALRADVLAFFPEVAPQVTFLTGNHDPDISDVHTLDLAGGRIALTHGDILFDNLVPWSQDAAIAGEKVQEALQALPPEQRTVLEHRLVAFRRAAAAIPQRHQSERNPLKYAINFAKDTVWPPLRTLRVMRAWRDAPRRAAEFLQTYKPDADFLLVGHVHRPTITRTPEGRVIINTGSYTLPIGAYVVEIDDESVRVRKVERHQGEYRLGRVIETFSLVQK